MSGSLTRRDFIRMSVTATGGLIAVAYLPALRAGAAERASAVSLGAFVRIDPDGSVVIGARATEIGQGVITSLPMLIAEEMDADWDHVRVEQLPLGLEATAQPPGVRWKYGGQGAGGSTNVPDGWNELRQVGAQLRWRLVHAAAQRWGVAADEVRTDNGAAWGPGERMARYGELAAEAAKLDPPESDLPLKKPVDWRILGKPQRTVDAEAILTGRARYGLDVREPGMLTAVVARCPYFGGDVARVDDAKARAIPGVRHVVRLPAPPADQALLHNLAAGIAVVADDTWTALEAREALEITWKPGPGAGDSTAALEQRCLAALAQPLQVVRADGDAASAWASAANKLEATYTLPFLAHATMEPQNAYVQLAKDRALVIAPTQSPGQANRVVHELTGIPRLNIEVRLPRAGGGFGRRLETDAIAEAVLIAKQVKAPVKLMWTREDDLRNDFFRPFGVHRLRGTWSDDGALASWQHATAATPRPWRARGMEEDPAWSGTVDPHGIPAGCVPAYRTEFAGVPFALARGWWRGPVHTFTAFAIESFLDELAHAAGRDPLAFRLALYGPPRTLTYGDEGTLDTGRLAEVLRIAAQRIGWGRSPGAGRGLGLAAHFTFGGYAAHAIEVEVASDGALRVARCVCAVDVGVPVNPLGIEAQMMGGTLDGLSAALHQEITVKDGRIEQANFDAYRLLTMREAPREVEVHVVPSSAPPSGAGEMGVPSAAPALANAIFAATGRRIRRLPIGAQLRA